MLPLSRTPCQLERLREPRTRRVCIVEPFELVLRVREVQDRERRGSAERFRSEIGNAVVQSLGVYAGNSTLLAARYLSRYGLQSSRPLTVARQLARRI